MMRVVVNPGHSTSDPGAIGPTGLTEAEVVQRVARCLVALSGDGVGYEPKRQPPGKKGLGILLETLRANPPQLLLSLHCNAHAWRPGKCIHEAQFYWWRDDPDIWRRGRSLKLAMCLSVAAQEGRLAEKAKTVSSPYSRQSGGGVVSFVPAILRKTATLAPSLAELSFITDPHAEAAMRTVEWQGRAACALDDGIRAFCAALPQSTDSQEVRT